MTAQKSFNFTQT